MGYELDFHSVLEHRDDIIRGTIVTLVLTVAALATGFALSLLAVYLRTSRIAMFRWLTVAYVEALRNTPMLVQLFFIYFGFAAMGLRMSPELGAYLVVSINVGAYSTEIVRAGLEATPRTQIEAGLSLAMTRLQVFRLVMLKPALQRIFPALASQFVMVMLGTSVASQIGADELTSIGNFIQSRNFRSFEVYVVIGGVYLALAIMFRSLFSLINRRFIANR